MRELVWLARSAHRCILHETLDNTVWHVACHWRMEDSRCNRHHSNTKLGQVTRHRHHHTIHSTLTCTVGNLASLCFFSSNTTNKKDYSLFASVIYGFVFWHSYCGILRNIHWAHHVYLDDCWERFCIQAAFRSQHHWRPCNASTSERDVQRSESCYSFFNRIFHILFLGDVTF